MFDFWRFFIGGSIWLFVLWVALWRGGRPERIVAATKLVSMFATPVFQYRPQGMSVDLGVMAVDLVVFVVVLAVALRYDRWWAMFAAGFHALMMGLHITMILAPRTSHFTYMTAEVVFSYGSLFALASGVVLLEIRRVRENRIDPLRA